MLHEFVSVHRQEIIDRNGVPLFLDQLVDALRSGTSTAEIDRTAAQHGLDLLAQGFSVSQVVHDYGNVCQTITELAVETNAPISADDFRTLNSSLDEAIAAAVTTYAHESQSRASIKQYEASERGNERVGFLVHELRNLVNTAIVAFEVVKTGNVGVSGSTGGVLQRSLLGLRDLIAHSLDEVRMIKGTTNRRRIVVANFIQDVADSARLAANARGIKLSVPPVDHDIAIDGDEQILAAVLGNLLQNATKFTHSDTEVALRVKASADRVLIEVEDECGGLPGGGDAKELTALNDGRLYARNLPGRGCVFTVDLPRAMARTPA